MSWYRAFLVFQLVIGIPFFLLGILCRAFLDAFWMGFETEDVERDRCLYQ